MTLILRIKYDFAPDKSGVDLRKSYKSAYPAWRGLRPIFWDFNSYSMLISAIIALLLFSINLSAQISQSGEPLSFNTKNIPLLNNIIPVFSMPAIDIEKLKAEDIINDTHKEIPWRFGENIEVNIDFKSNGVKDVLPNGDKIWRLRIYSAGALTLNFTFDKYILPDYAKLFFYNEQKTSVFGAFTNFNNQTDNYFATSLMEGEAIIIEYFEPVKVNFEGQLHLKRVTHGYRNVLDFTMKAENSFGSSGSCEINVKCPLASSLDNEIRSVCMLVTNSNGFCTGTLVNNTSNDGTPYILTANHCSTSNNFGSWVFWFNWQSPTCTDPITSPAHQSISGCTLKARSNVSDFCLVQMSSVPPTDYNVFYSGWDKSGNATPSTYCIHHPAGDIKKVSHATSTSDSLYINMPCWNVFWTINGNGQPIEGVTEGGSSGSPLFDTNHRIIGQLYGGPSFCTATGATNINDFFGRFSYSWDSCGITSDVRLKDWLDSANTQQKYINGSDFLQIKDVLTQDNQIQTYPNPTNGLINMININHSSNIQLFDLSGKLVFTQDKLNPNTQINIKNLSNGMYFLKVFSNDKYYYSKVILVR